VEAAQRSRYWLKGHRLGCRQHVFEGIEEPNGEGQARVRGQAGDNGVGATFADAAFDDVTVDLPVLDVLREAGEILDAFGADLCVAANADALLGDVRLPISEKVQGVEYFSIANSELDAVGNGGSSGLPS
jgi:hypothetical protein